MGENKKTIGKADFFFIRALSVSLAGLSSRLSSKCRLSRARSELVVIRLMKVKKECQGAGVH